MRQSGRISPGPAWESITNSSSEGGISDHVPPPKTSQNTPRKRKSDAVSSPSRQNLAKSRRLNPQTTQDRNTAPTPSISTSVGQTRAFRTNNVDEHNRFTQSSSGSKPNSTNTPRMLNSDATKNTPTTSSNGGSKISQRLSLTQPAFSAKTRVKRNKPAKMIIPSSRSSSELPESIFVHPRNATASSKTAKPLLLAAERNKHASLRVSSAKPGVKKVAAAASPKRAVPKQFIGEVIEISSDDDLPKTSRPIPSVHQTSSEILEISSDDEPPKSSIPNVSSPTAKPKFKSPKTSSTASNFRATAPVIDKDLNSTAKAESASPSSGSRLPPAATISNTQISTTISEIATHPKSLAPAVHLDQIDDIDMLDADPLDCFADSSGNLDVPSPIGPITNVSSKEPFFQATQPDMRSPSASKTVAKSACNTMTTFVDTLLNGAAVPRNLTTINDRNMQANLTPLEADVAMFNLASDNKDDRDSTVFHPPSIPVSLPSSIPSPNTASRVSNHRISSSPAGPKSSNPVTNDPYPMTEGVWGYARRRIERQTLNTGSGPRISRPMTTKPGFGKEVPSSSKRSDRNTESSTLPSEVTSLDPMSIFSPSSPPSALSVTSSSLPKESIAALNNKDALEAGAIESPTTTTLSHPAKSASPQSLADVLNHAREGYPLCISSNSPEASSPHPRQSSHNEDRRRQDPANAINNADKDPNRISTPLSATPQSNRGSPASSTKTPYSDITREMSTLHLASSAEDPPCGLRVKDDEDRYADKSSTVLVDSAWETTSQVLDANSQIGITGPPAQVLESLAETSHSVHSFDETARELKTTQIDHDTTMLEKHHSSMQVDNVDISVDVPESSAIEDTVPTSTPVKVIPGMQTDDVSLDNAGDAVVEVPRDLVHATLRGPGQGTSSHPEETQVMIKASAGFTLQRELDLLDTVSDEEILMYPEEDDELVITSSNRQSSTATSAQMQVLPTLGYLECQSSGTSKASSWSSPGIVSLSRSLSSDPIDLLVYTKKSDESQLKNLTVITWPDIRAATRRLKPKHLLAKDLPHSLQDNMNAMDPYFRSLPMARTIFEAAISENTMEDEPDAPPIKIINEIDDEPTPPWEFYYTNQMWHGEGVPGPDIENLLSCDCEGSCDLKSTTCVCLKRQQEFTSEFTPDFAYDRRGRLRQNDIPIFECNDLCGCGEECRNRVVQHGRKCIVYIGKTKEKGWGVFVGPKKIPSGTYIGIYSGELLTDAESEMRGLTYNICGRTYLFDIDHHHLRKAAGENWETKYVVDAYHAGNFTRFLNHSCDPNCTLNACYINDADIDKPLLAVFTSRDVEPGEELCFSYFGAPDSEAADEGEDDDLTFVASRPKDAVDIPCRCGAANCTGIMFR